VLVEGAFVAFLRSFELNYEKVSLNGFCACCINLVMSNQLKQNAREERLSKQILSHGIMVFWLK
jgi:hypothetical protein